MAMAQARRAGGRAGRGTLDRIATAVAVAKAGATGDRVAALSNRLDLDRITNIVVIYAENRSFNNLYGNFPGAKRACRPTKVAKK